MFQAQKETPTAGDFVLLVEKDMQELGVSYEEITQCSKVDLKKKLKVCATNASFHELKKRLLQHKKVKHIQYTSLQLQPYLTSPNIHKEEAHILTACRSKCIKNVRSNFSKMFKNRLFCPLQCNQENPQIDTQEHLLTCTKIKIQNTNNLKIQDVFQEVDSQENIGKLLVEILQKRTRLISELETSLPGAILDQGSLLQGATAV